MVLALLPKPEGLDIIEDARYICANAEQSGLTAHTYFFCVKYQVMIMFIFHTEVNKPGFILNYIYCIMHLRQAHLKFTVFVDSFLISSNHE